MLSCDHSTLISLAGKEDVYIHDHQRLRRINDELVSPEESFPSIVSFLGG